MSTLYNDEWAVGETWSWIVECTDADGNDIAVDSASFRLQREGQTFLLLTAEPYVSIAGNVVTVIVPTDDQLTIPAAVYERELYVVDDENSVSRQLHGDLTVTRRPFTRAEVEE
jgi:hypothetical protein